MFGNSARILQKLAIHILNQTSFECERNWSVFEHIHTKKINRLEDQRLNDLVYVTYDLCLKNKYRYFLCQKSKQNSKYFLLFSIKYNWFMFLYGDAW